MNEQIIGGARVAVKNVVASQLSEGERQKAEVEAERQEMARRRFFNGDPIAALESLLLRVSALEEALAGLKVPEPAGAPLERTLTNLEKAQDAIDSHPRHVEPPAAIADLFHPDKPMAPQAKALRDKWLEIGHQIHRGEASADEIRKHERLSSEIQFLNSHAFDGV